MKCTLCDAPESKRIHKDPQNGSLFYSCLVCGFIFRDPQFFLSSEKEFERYQNHENDVNSVGYQNFLMPVIDQVLKLQTLQHQGLDYGCGPNSVVVHLLKNKGYNILEYDLFFYPDEEKLKTHYDYVVCTEVVEHFRNPQLEFRKVANLLKPGGSLIIKTSLTDQVADFANWHYHRDPTHVGFFNQSSLQKVAELTELKLLNIESTHLVFKKSE